MMDAIDRLTSATIPEEKRAALVQWRATYGDPMEFLAEGKLSAVVRQTIPANRCRDFLRAYQRNRNQFVEQFASAPDSISSWFDGPEFEFHFAVYSIAQELSNDLASARDILEELLLSNDTEMMGVASALFERLGENAWPSFPRICEALANHGVFEGPFHIASALAASVRADSDRLFDIEERLREGNDRERQALFFVLCELGHLAAPLVDLVLEIIRLEGVGPDTKSCAFSALGELGIVNENVESAIRQAIDSPYWFIRGNAISAAGQLRLASKEFVPLIARHLTDREGHDWCAAEKAVTALGCYGSVAASTIPQLEALLHPDDDDLEGQSEIKATIARLCAEPGRQ